MTLLGAVACGHPLTAEAAAAILRDGGNAFDAAVAAGFMACVAEPVFASLGGGGYLLAAPANRPTQIHDFFVQTPRVCRPAQDLDFRPIVVDFGTAQQVFHAGLGAAAVPGMVRGLFTIQRHLCTMPMRALLAPAITAAREGVVVNDLQAYALRIIGPIYTLSAPARALFESRTANGAMLQAGELLRQPELADTLDTLGREGDRLFYEGEIAQRIAAQCRDGGGNLDVADLAVYRAIQRAPLQLGYRGAQLLTNPPPSCGGTLIAFALKLLEACTPRTCGFGSAKHLELLAQVMRLTDAARREADMGSPGAILHPQYMQRFRATLRRAPCCARGTTHISIIDAAGNVASLSVSNGEGCGHLIPGTGVMLNNMLGEEDLCPRGFHRWPTAARLGSMMAPCLLRLPGRDIAFGSGGSNRIRTALLQVIVNLIDHAMPLAAAVTSPRIHLENDLLSVEGGFTENEIARLAAAVPIHKLWPERNLFFGGVHAVSRTRDELEGAGDPRRDGVARDVYN